MLLSIGVVSFKLQILLALYLWPQLHHSRSVQLFHWTPFLTACANHSQSVAMFRRMMLCDVPNDLCRLVLSTKLQAIGTRFVLWHTHICPIPPHQHKTLGRPVQQEPLPLYRMRMYSAVVIKYTGRTCLIICASCWIFTAVMAT